MNNLLSYPGRLKHETSWFHAGAFDRRSLYKADWADELIQAYFEHPHASPITLLDHLAQFDNAFLRLPDGRWYVSWHGIAIPPMASRAEGVEKIHELITLGHVKGIPATHLSDNTQARNFSRTVEAAGLTISIPNDDRQGIGKFRKYEIEKHPIQELINYVIEKINEHSSLVASALNHGIDCDEKGVFFFKDPNGEQWLTEAPPLPADASMIKARDGWEIYWQGDDEPIRVSSKHNTGMTHIARLLEQTGVLVPSGLLANDILRSRLAGRPPYQKLFSKTYRRPRVTRGSLTAGKVEEAVCDAMGLQRGKGWYEATHMITSESPLASYIGTGYVDLTTEGLEGVLNLLYKRRAEFALPECGIKARVPAELQSLVDRVDKAVKYVRQYEGLLDQVEMHSSNSRPKVRMAISDAKMELRQNGALSLVKYLDENLTTGKLCTHNGSLLWDVRGLTDFPNPVELAIDHTHYKRKKLENRSDKKSTGSFRQNLQKR